MAELESEEVDLCGNWLVQKDRSVIGDATEHLECSLLVRGAPVVEDDREAFVLDGPVDALRKLPQRSAPPLGLGRELETVHAYVDGPLDPYDPAGVGARPAADARDQRIAGDEAAQLGPCLVRHARELRPGDDRGERSVDVEHDRCLRRVLDQRTKQGVRTHGHTIRRVARLLAIGLVAGVFSALFGVGGGIIIVPLLVALVGFDGRRATGTSLAAIGITAAAGALAYGLHGDLKVGSAALVGLPAAVGAVTGVALQQRLQTRTLTFGFSLVLAAVGIRLLV